MAAAAAVVVVVVCRGVVCTGAPRPDHNTSIMCVGRVLASQRSTPSAGTMPESSTLTPAIPANVVYLTSTARTQLVSKHTVYLRPQRVHG